MTTNRNLFISELRRLSILIGAICALSQIAPTAFANDNSPAATRPRISTCGPNSLFVYLILEGRHDISYEDIQKIPVANDGVSILDLKNMANQLRENAIVCRFAATAIATVPFPAIVQIKSHKNSDKFDHFAVAYKIESDRLYLIDGTSALTVSMPISEFSPLWSGVAMIHKGRGYLGIISWSAAGMAICYGAILLSKSSLSRADKLSTTIPSQPSKTFSCEKDCTLQL